MATLLALSALGYMGQALFIKGITETTSSIYDIFKSVIIINCPEVVNFIEKYDLEFKINVLHQFFNEIEIINNSDALNDNLQDIYQVILLFKLELIKIQKILQNHPKTFLYKIIKPNYIKEMKRLTIYSSLLDTRLHLFKTLIKSYSSNVIKIKEKETKLNNKYSILNENEYIIL